MITKKFAKALKTWATPMNCRKYSLGRNLKLLKPESIQEELKAMKQDPVLMQLISDVKRDFGELGGFYYDRKNAAIGGRLRIKGIN